MKNVVVTLANENYLVQAKALFSSIFWNSGWTGDYLLLAHQVPQEELAWFREKGIIVYDCEPLFTDKLGDYPSVVLDKLYLFTPYFKKWSHVIFMDADMVVRASLDELTKVKDFAATTDQDHYAVGYNIREQPGDLYEKLRSQFDLRKPGFSSGRSSFDTDIIDGDRTFAGMKSLLQEYGKLFNGDQPLFNIYFQKWAQLPRIFNICVPNGSEVYTPLIRPGQKGLYHLSGYYKPWHKENPFYEEWQSNLVRADQIDLSNRQMPSYPLDNQEISRFQNVYDGLKDTIKVKLDLLHLYYWDKKMYRRRVLAETFKRNPLRFKHEFLYYFVSLLPEKSKVNIKNSLRAIGLLPKDVAILGKVGRERPVDHD